MICEQCNHFRNKCNYDKYCIEKEKVNAIYQQGRADMKAEYESADIPLIHGKEELSEHDKQIRADVIDGCIKIVKNTTRHFYIDEVITQMEQLKEQK